MKKQYKNNLSESRWDRTTSKDGVTKERAMRKGGNVPRWYEQRTLI